MPHQNNIELEQPVDDSDVTFIRDAAKEWPDFKPIYVPLIEAPKWFGVSRDTIYRASKAGDLEIYKAGSRSILKVTEVQRWVERSGRSA
ncbi:hypothetical protein N6L27_05350 [Leisingera sp. SS27]|uniref:hypothetical protein n=1 Tax=Leisingera sp. SS27 TaxID=2979462 RepID=UPI002330AEAD|nr:hypothetical protein [Leisingera sp. SS27]MDC0657415.1 hypothetical protein [Leisingera sp. SS27]